METTCDTSKFTELIVDNDGVNPSYSLKWKKKTIDLVIQVHSVN